MIGRARRREPASVGPRNLVDSECANDLFDKIDIALQVPPMARNFPFRRPSGASFFQTEPGQNLIDGLRLNRDADDSIGFFVGQRNVSRIRRHFARHSNFFCRSSIRDLANQFGCAVRCPQNHFRIDPAFEAITRVAR